MALRNIYQLLVRRVTALTPEFLPLEPLARLSTKGHTTMSQLRIQLLTCRIRIHIPPTCILSSVIIKPQLQKSMRKLLLWIITQLLKPRKSALLKPSRCICSIGAFEQNSGSSRLPRPFPPAPTTALSHPQQHLTILLTTPPAAHLLAAPDPRRYAHPFRAPIQRTRPHSRPLPRRPLPSCPSSRFARK